MAPVEQAAWHAVFTDPSFSGVPAFLASSLAACRRCWHIEHFSITPLLRTTTSGFSTIFPSSCCAGLTIAKSGLLLKSNQLKRRTLNGQLLAQYLVPMHRL